MIFMPRVLCYNVRMNDVLPSPAVMAGDRPAQRKDHVELELWKHSSQFIGSWSGKLQTC